MSAQQDELNRFNPRSIEWNKHEWATWFAWRPVTLTYTGKRVWLQRIYRRAQYKTYSTYNDGQRWEYGTIFDVLTTIDTKPQHQRL